MHIGQACRAEVSGGQVVDAIVCGFHHAGDLVVVAYIPEADRTWESLDVTNNFVGTPVVETILQEDIKFLPRWEAVEDVVAAEQVAHENGG